jgi:nucleotide-binding universal stress UspA family protein
MSTLLLPIPRFHGRGLPLDWSNRILVAADGRESSDPAIAMAWTLTNRSLLDLISVLKARARGVISEEARAERVSTVEAQLNRVIGTVPDGDVVMETGSPADIIATSARLRGSSLLVIGLGTCPVRDRLLGEELALAIARRAHTPLLAVAPGHTSRPKRLVVGMDFSPASYSACEAGLTIADDDAHVVLVNVHDANTRRAPAGALQRLVEKVQTGFPGRVTAVERHGDAAGQLLEIAAQTCADTLVIGGHGQTGAMETALGPVATRIIRCAPVSVLLVPAFGES